MKKNMKQKNLLISIAINISITVVELIVGTVIGSLALISDGIHNFFDVGSMVVSLFGEKASQKKSDLKHSYGYRRAEILVALLNSFILLFSTIFIGYESIQRLFNPQPVEGNWMLIMAGVALVGNAIATKLLHQHAEESMNIRAAFLHSLQDALFSAGVIVASILILVFKWQWVDAGIAFILSLLLAKEAITLVLETVHVLMEGVPVHVDLRNLRKDILLVKDIVAVYDLHVWSNGSKDLLLTAHVLAKVSNNRDHVEKIKSIQKMLVEKYQIDHSTVQLISTDFKNELKDVCKHCN